MKGKGAPVAKQRTMYLYYVNLIILIKVSRCSIIFLLLGDFARNLVGRSSLIRAILETVDRAHIFFQRSFTYIFICMKLLIKKNFLFVQIKFYL